MKKLLIIDDEFIFRQGLKYMLDWESHGYTIIGEASNGQEGLQLAMELRPDVILCDVVMPVMNGVDFVKRLRQFPICPVIMLSNFDEFDKVRQAFQYGATDYLLKSRVTKEDILHCLDQTTLNLPSSTHYNYDKTFGMLARAILDGYSASSTNDFRTHVQNHLASECYVLLVINSPSPDFSSEEHLSQYLREYLEERAFCSCYTTQSHALALIAADNTSNLDFLRSLIDAFSTRLRHTSCGISLPFNNLDLFKEKAEAMYDLSTYSIFYDDKCCFQETMSQQDPASADAFSDSLYHSCTSSGHWEHACQILLEYIEQFHNTQALHPYQLKKFIEYTFYSSLKDARNYVDSPSAVAKIELKLFKQLDLATSFSQLTDSIAWAYGEIASLSPQQEDHLILSLRQYLEIHYAEQITLHDLANHLHMNYSYLSAYISQKTGMRFSEHLNSIRIEHAKQLLLFTDNSISKISFDIGYTDQSYFGKIFKKLVGSTPLQYRNHFEKEE